MSLKLSTKKYPLDTKIRLETVDRLAEYVFKIMVYFVSSLVIYLVLKQGDFIDYGLLGNVETVQFWLNYPCVSKPKYLEDVYVAKFAYHFYELVICALFHRKNRDFPELILHHITTIVLIILSFTGQHMVPGSTIMLIHDASDIFILICRIARELGNDLVLILSWLVMFSCWCYLRLYYYFDRIIKVWIFDIWYNKHYFIRSTYNLGLGLMSILYVLHIFWTFMMIKTLVQRFWYKQPASPQ